MRKNRIIYFTIVLFIVSVSLVTGQETIQFNASWTTRPFNHFWKSTGFVPASLAERDDMQQTITMQGAVVNNGLQYNRPHYLLDLVSLTESSGVLSVDFDRFDRVVDLFVNNNVKLVFEIMGNPSGFFTDFEEDRQVRLWKEFIKQLAIHMMDRYGRDELRSWYFETWNEPDTDFFWKQSVKAFLNYYDATSEALREADQKLILGGPGNAFKFEKLTKDFFDHCARGTNYFTGEKGVRVDFFTTHKKAMPYAMAESELEIYNALVKEYPMFKSIPFGNDEADPTWGWSDQRWWRATQYYSSFIVKNIDIHYRKMRIEKDLNYFILSNDNGFLGNWYQRTNFAHFVNDSGFYLVKKPCFTVLSLCSLLGDQYINHTNKFNESYGFIPTKRSDGSIAVLTYNLPEMKHVNFIRESTVNNEDSIRNLFKGMDKTLKVRIKDIPFDNYIVTVYRISESKASPFLIWKNQGKPQFPSKEQVKEMRNAQEIVIESNYEATGKNIEMEIPLKVSDVSMILITPVDNNKPEVISGIKSQDYNGLNGEKETLLRWNEANRLKTLGYQVQFRKKGEKRFNNLHKGYIIDPYFLHADSEKGEYRIFTVGYDKKKSKQAIYSSHGN